MVLHLRVPDVAVIIIIISVTIIVVTVIVIVVVLLSVTVVIVIFIVTRKRCQFRIILPSGANVDFLFISTD